jgi:hypothetical protein
MTLRTTGTIAAAVVWIVAIAGILIWKKICPESIWIYSIWAIFVAVAYTGFIIWWLY